ncbi:DUF1801 domain-containing protein [Tepidiforma sp.]|jgi:hypothetical protein|uniref:DUF1801 domain-containing protein n=1 Tax=Tepidiforma sp. TaxID=2682230 RepID=UPI00262190AF|nr:DUF1801 domain-containing protein [Tepidiforma sp.]MCX7618468.1 DUF1801 domain-containing protein [Tepidiforma sp.]
MAETAPPAGTDPIAERIAAWGGWRAGTLTLIRELIREAVPGVVEELKWVKPTNPLGVVAWSHAGLLCTGEAYRGKVKVTFARGASLPDPAGLFNAGFGGGTRRAIDLAEGDTLDAEAFRQLVRAAADLNEAAKAAKARAR